MGVSGMISRPQYSFLFILGLMSVFATIIGHGIVGLWRGNLIDERNKLSLSRFQLVIWTFVVLSGYLAAALWNIAHASVDSHPLAIAIPKELWWLMGISTISLAASPLVLSLKQAMTPDPKVTVVEERKEEKERMIEDLKLQNLHSDAIGTQGKIVFWKWLEDARLADLFQGDEIATQAKLDLGKVQMFFFTLILAFAYVAMLLHQFSNATGPISEFPALDQSMIALLGISHAGYLTNKGVPHGAE